MRPAATILILLCVSLSTVHSQHLEMGEFSHQLVRMCLKPELIRDFPVTTGITKIFCSRLCLTRGPQCQGFRLTSNSCQTFEFDKCSHMANQATACSQFQWIYVRKQSGLPHGQLCPSGFGNKYYGSTYSMVNVSNWTEGLSICSSMPGLTKYADGHDRPENDYFHTLKTSMLGYLPSNRRGFFIGGYRAGNSATGVWLWQACNVSFQPEVWGSGQPNEGNMGNRAGIWHSHANGVDDTPEVTGVITRSLCKCINPFV